MAMAVIGDIQVIGDQDGVTQVGDILDIGVAVTTTTILTATEEEDLLPIMGEEIIPLTEILLQTEITAVAEITPQTETSLQTEAEIQPTETIPLQDQAMDIVTIEEVLQ